MHAPTRCRACISPLTQLAGSAHSFEISTRFTISYRSKALRTTSEVWTMVKLPKLKTKPKRTIPVTSCALELSSLLQCWATTNDLQSIGACSEVAKNLSRCMVTAKAAPAQRADSINFR
ncbi:uncharacterized protein MELLADRAFT_113837 [Melampsora larici-populina 98AG31]|uniref:37S ribosomal protein mrp10, mitochondrial n=1 Tax=Melampsora larici-populina (strain 98AG31 / pathotype 3-4-7) TaxID=747676 RepID=F4SB74_MELLP|nr:uncharacterized protein MELLADRAFT_113837 [Melampsora larici-populina 98AG31]EGF98116.1 hypothetical protein MELLADRAFT_113837 [Melampsora larici-populina 98AG31]